MSNDPITPVDKSSAAANTTQTSPSRSSADNLSQIKAEISYMSMLDIPVLGSARSPFNNILQELDDPSDSPGIESNAPPQPAADAPAKDDTAPPPASSDTSSSASTSTSSSSSSSSSDSSVKKDVQDANDMWSVDARLMNPMDLKIIQNLGQGAPAPIPTLNNLSPSLIEQMPSSYYKSLGGSQGLQTMLEQAYKTQRPVRVDLSEDSAVILRLGRDGRVSAEFMSSDKSAEMFYQQNLQELKSRLESKQLAYGELVVRNWQEQPQDKGKRQQQDQQQ